MKEIIEKRRTHCKVFDLGGRKRKVRVSRAPLHYLRDGKLVDIDTTPRLAGKLLEVTEAPYRLKVDPERPAYLYTNETGRQVEVELIEAGGSPLALSRRAQEAGTIKWKGIAPSTDIAIRPLRRGVEALVVLYGPDAPKSWRWRVRGDKDLLLPPKGHDAKQQALELTHSYDGDVLTITWTGRVTSSRRLRRREGWTEEVAWPVAIDPTVNESIASGGDDVESSNGAFFSAGQSGLNVGVYANYLYYAGFRFQGVALPQAAEITAATLSIDVLIVAGAPDLNVYADDVDNAPAWSTGSRVRNITKTTALTSVPISGTGIVPIGVTGIIQEIVNRAGWASGNAIRFGLFSTKTSGVNVAAIAALEHATRTEAQLEIEYEEAAAAIVAPKMMHYMRLHNG